ncbi:MAG TPA: sugar-transfer associated ATP-grasp domain-containing protein [Casimicrobiaceae bacterium]|nr:sugar-transfer associated ATP-grasp domain-containing protein [Casimicrobiaceae bacterium]
MWQELLNLCTSAANHFPGLNLQNWDVVVTEHGPMLMELNTEADLFAVNLLTRVGLLRGRLEAMTSGK